MNPHRPLRHPMETTFYVSSGGMRCRCDDCRRANRLYQSWYMATHPEQLQKRKAREQGRVSLVVRCMGERLYLATMPPEVRETGILLKRLRRVIAAGGIE